MHEGARSHPSQGVKRERGEAKAETQEMVTTNAKKTAAFLRKRPGKAAQKRFQQKGQQRAVQKEGRVCSNPM